ncbi:MAG TPA: NAD(P)H-hydrate dehydratase [Egibacteraceae bacterium]|nr:NAD(P)H-hydrate dehydratase [Egibacteraceae bacterium]
MIPLYLPGSVRAMDERAIAGGTPSLELMERAAGHLARAVTAAAGRSYGLRVAVLCGKGNNGGDGLAAARRLLDAGAAPLVWLAAAPEELSRDAAAQLARWRAAGGRVAASAADALRDADVAVDCLLGTGAAGAPRGAVAGAIAAVTASGLPVVACDAPSGVDASTGQVAGPAVRADVTVTLGAEKLGLRLWPARGLCGRLLHADIGVRNSGDAPDAVVLEDADVAALLPAPEPDADKRSRGIVLIVAGSDGMAGAAVLAARGALASGAGLVTVMAPEPVRPLIAQAVPAALTVALPHDPGHAADLVNERAADSDAAVFGPGRGRGDADVALARAVVAGCAAPLVLDADGLNAYRHDGDALAGHASRLLVCTPHRRELERLTGEEDVWARRAAAAPELAARWDTVLVAKGPGTVTAAPGGRRWVNATGSASLATGGTGDVLAGVLGALLARSPRPETVAAGVHLHGLAGEAAARERTVRGAGPVDVVRGLSEAWRRLEAAA